MKNLLEMTRRRFVQIAGAVGAAPAALKAADAPTAEAIVQRMQSALGGEWAADGVDGFKAGDPAAPVKGIAVSAMATMDVLKKAAQSHANLILTHEPTFFGKQDGPAPPPEGPAGRFFRGVSADDPVYVAKKAFIENNGLVVYRLHDNWLSRKGPEMTAGLAEALGWGEHRVRPDDSLYEIPAASAAATVAHIRESLNLRGGLRAVGDRDATVRRVLLLPGFTTPAVMRRLYTEADMLLTGEVREWENTFYAADMFTAGQERNLVTVGRVASEDPGMRACAQWLRTVVDDVPTHWISAGDLYWRATS